MLQSTCVKSSIGSGSNHALVSTVLVVLEGPCASEHCRLSPRQVAWSTQLMTWLLDCIWEAHSCILLRDKRTVSYLVCGEMPPQQRADGNSTRETTHCDHSPAKKSNSVHTCLSQAQGLLSPQGAVSDDSQLDQASVELMIKVSLKQGG
eukprot:105964-Amphidinium_carterae.1